MISSISYYITLLRKDFKSYCSKKLERYGLSPGLLFFLLYIGKHPECSQKELSDALQMDSGHTTRSLNKLEREELIEQKTNEKDKRARSLVLTKKGTEAFNASHELFYQWDNDRTKHMKQDEKEQLLHLLKKMVSSQQTDEGETFDERKVR